MHVSEFTSKNTTESKEDIQRLTYKTRYMVSEFLQTDSECKGIKITNRDAVIDHLVRLFELWDSWDPYDDDLFIRYYVQGYAAGVQSQAK